jgi:cell division protein FtsQ
MQLQVNHHRMSRSFKHRGNYLIKVSVWIVVLAVIALPIVAALNGWYATDRWPLSQLRVSTNLTRVNVDQIRGAVMPHARVGFFAVDLAQIQKTVERIPWVARAEVQKQWPDTLIVRITEFEAVAIWNERQLISVDGIVFNTPGNALPEGLVHLSGPELRHSEVLAFYRDLLPMMRGVSLKIDALGLNKRGSWSMRFIDGSRLALGNENPTGRLERFLRVLPKLSRTEGKKESWVYADLRYSNGFAIAWETNVSKEQKLKPVTDIENAPDHSNLQVESNYAPQI